MKHKIMLKVFPYKLRKWDIEKNNRNSSDVSIDFEISKGFKELFISPVEPEPSNKTDINDDLSVARMPTSDSKSSSIGILPEEKLSGKTTGLYNNKDSSSINEEHSEIKKSSLA